MQFASLSPLGIPLYPFPRSSRAASVQTDLALSIQEEAPRNALRQLVLGDFVTILVPERGWYRRDMRGGGIWMERGTSRVDLSTIALQRPGFLARFGGYGWIELEEAVLGHCPK